MFLAEREKNTAKRNTQRTRPQSTHSDMYPRCRPLCAFRACQRRVGRENVSGECLNDLDGHGTEEAM